MLSVHFSFICKDEIRCTSGNLYLLCVLTVVGITYFFKLKNICTYKSFHSLDYEEHVKKCETKSRQSGDINLMENLILEDEIWSHLGPIEESFSQIEAKARSTLSFMIKLVS